MSTRTRTHRRERRARKFRVAMIVRRSLTTMSLNAGVVFVVYQGCCVRRSVMSAGW
jgi:hypothetical protein